MGLLSNLLYQLVTCVTYKIILHCLLPVNFSSRTFHFLLPGFILMYFLLKVWGGGGAKHPASENLLCSVKLVMYPRYLYNMMNVYLGSFLSKSHVTLQHFWFLLVFVCCAFILVYDLRPNTEQNF